jgi:hypothetical protein
LEENQVTTHTQRNTDKYSAHFKLRKGFLNKKRGKRISLTKGRKISMPKKSAKLK